MPLSRRTLVRGIAGASALTALAGCSGDSGADPTPTTAGAPESATAEMTDNLNFAPETVEVSVGGTVTWENVGAVAHSVTAYEDGIPEDADYFASGDFDAQAAANEAYPEEGALGEGDTYQHTFDTPGEYDYYCIPHESVMKGTVVVRE